MSLVFIIICIIFKSAGEMIDWVSNSFNLDEMPIFLASHPDRDWQDKAQVCWFENNVMRKK